MVISPMTSHSAHSLVVLAHPVSAERIAQNYAFVSAQPYLVAGGAAQDYPLLSACSVSSARVGP